MDFSFLFFCFLDMYGFPVDRLQYFKLSTNFTIKFSEESESDVLYLRQKNGCLVVDSSVLFKGGMDADSVVIN